jgi:hypothetical protein
MARFGTAQSISTTISIHRGQPYFLADGIYPKLKIFRQSKWEPVLRKYKLCIQLQEACTIKIRDNHWKSNSKDLNRKNSIKFVQRRGSSFDFPTHYHLLVVADLKPEHPSKSIPRVAVLHRWCTIGCKLHRLHGANAIFFKTYEQQRRSKRCSW